ncbi:MAG: asparagine synthase (glutamine-hydrolyzing) [Acidobacteriaceae bacterium]
MCGIAGLINCGDRPALQAMADVIAHRGPDSEGLEWFASARSGLAHRRLAILDLSPAGHQPMSTDDGRYWITYNGELYNYRDLRAQLQQHGFRFRSQSDTEVLLKAYRHWGAECLSRFNGMFAFAIYDVQTRTLFAARDRFGVKPFYYVSDGTRFIFASEIKAILATGLVAAEPDYFALHTPARFQLSPLTGFQGILKLPPAHSLTWHDGRLEIARYWRLDPCEDPTIAESAALEQLDSLLGDAVRLQMIADVPVGVFLSGGVDSSIISAMARRNTSHDIHSFTIRYSDQDQKLERATPDEVFARQVAKDFGFVYHEIELAPDVVDLLPRMVWHLDEPVSEPASINTWLISQAARENGIVVLLNGMAGDEVFGGYLKHMACLNAEAYQRMLPGPVRRALEAMVKRVPVATARHGSKSLRRIKRFFSFASLPRTMRYLMSDASLSAEQYRSQFLGEPDYQNTHFIREQQTFMDRDGLSYLTAMCLNDTNVFLPEHNLTFSDKGSMAAGVESRPPMTDHRVVEFMFSLPPSFRINGVTQKYLLKKLAARYLPGSVVYRPKANFASPLRSWVRGPLAPMIGDLLSEQSLKNRGLYNPAYVRDLIRKNDAGIEDNAYVLWTLLTNEIWFRTFFSGSPGRLASMAPLAELQVAP